MITSLNIVDSLFLYAVASTWFLLLFNVILALNGFMFYLSIDRKKRNYINDTIDFPNISILVPAHNEEKVIEKTVRALYNLSYPKDKLEIIIINDNSTDKTGEILKRLKDKLVDFNLNIITTDKINGGKGKSNALNIGFKQSKGSYIVVYDADNTPEKQSLKYLVCTIISNQKYGAVIGKFRTRNKNKNLLTRFINIETLSFQWMIQAGRWQLFRLCTIPGTNFIIRRNVIQELGGWDSDAITEDTEISFRIYKLGYKICFMPLAVTWEQEPETLKVWFKQRTRWVKGNIYVLNKYFLRIFRHKTKSILFDLYYFISVYFLFLSSVIISDVIFVLGLFTNIKISLSGNYLVIWILAYVLFILEISITLTLEKGESNPQNIMLVSLMYFTYCQLWIIVSIKGIISYLKDILLNKDIKWYKTERF